MKHHAHFSRQRPPWWPENEEWPPKRWRMMRGNPFFRRMGCLFLVLLGILLGPFVDFPLAQAFASAKLILPIGLAGFLILVSVTFWGVRSLRRMSMPLDELLNASNRVADGDFFS